ncbi:hypothetical protein ES705_49398 [subsurface metagenome]
MFTGLDLEIIKTIKKRPETELEDSKLSYFRREEIKIILSNINSVLEMREREKR